jgi:hypothetical protein
MSKVAAIKTFPLPRNVQDARASLGLAGYYRSFIQDFALINKTLTLLTPKYNTFSWCEPQQNSFEALKEALKSESILAHLKFDKSSILSCDVSRHFRYPEPGT